MVDGKIAWLFPHRPVLTAFTMKRNIKAMGLISNVLSNVHVHALRHDAAQDEAHLPSAKDGAGATFQDGITRAYADHSTRDSLNDHTENEFVNPWGAKLSDTSAYKAVKQPVTIQEIKQWQSVHEPQKEDLDIEIAKICARKGVRQAR
ncbi:hypothetical protein MMC22_007963, partial [Lobaria immixta]|nr:hypothetical protein [Lobaria immixta]